MSLEDNLRKVPPQNLEAETAVLGAVFLEPDCINEILQTIGVKDFYRGSHQTIFRAMVDLHKAGTPIDVITLSEFLKSRNELESVGGSAYLAALSDFVPTAVNVRHYARIVKEKSQLRSVITVATKIATRGYEEQGSVEEFLEAAGEAYRASLNNGNGKQPKSPHHFNLISAGEVMAAEDIEQPSILEGMLPDGGASLLVSKPKVGKTTFGFNLAVAVSRGADFLGRKTQQGPVVYLALEEKRGEIKKKLIAAGITDEPIRFHFGSAPVDAMSQVEPLLVDTKAKLLIIDVLQKFCRLRDLNDYAIVTNALEPLMAAARKQACHILLTHHAGKADRPDGDDILGSTGLLGGVDTSIHIKKREKRRTFFTIQRYGDDTEETVIELREDGSLDATGTRQEVEIKEAKPLVLEALKNSSEPLTINEIWDLVEKGHTPVSKAVNLLVESKQIFKSGSGKKGDPYKYSFLPSSDTSEEGRKESKTADKPAESKEERLPDDFGLFSLKGESFRKAFSGQKTTPENGQKIDEVLGRIGGKIVRPT